MIILLAASLHSGVLEAASELCTKNIDYTESAFQAQTTETTHLIHHLYDYLLSLPFVLTISVRILFPAVNQSRSPSIGYDRKLLIKQPSIKDGLPRMPYHTQWIITSTGYGKL